jgi:hypothetical protein
VSASKDNAIKFELDNSQPLTVKGLVKVLQSFQKTMEAFGADDLEIESLHYDYEPPTPQNSVEERVG